MDGILLSEGVNNQSSSFPQFSQLHEDLKVSIIGFVADAPLEECANVPFSSLTHTLPLVSKQFHRMTSVVETFWKDAICRQATRHEPTLWRGALKKIWRECANGDNNQNEDSQTSKEEEISIIELVERVVVSKNYSGFKALYKDIVRNHLRFVAPVFYMGNTLERLGRPYALHFFEPRYQYMMADIMRDQSDTVRRGEGPVVGENSDVCFVHAMNPLRPLDMAVLVRVLRCGMFPDGRADVLMVPIQQVWLEQVWIRQNTGDLHYAKCLRLSKRKPDIEAAIRYHRHHRRQQSKNAHIEDQEGQPSIISIIKSVVIGACFFGVTVAMMLKGFQLITSSYRGHGRETAGREGIIDPTVEL